MVNAHTDVDTRDCTRGLYEQRKRVCLQSGLGRNSPLLQRGFEPESVLLLAFQSDAVPTVLLATCSHDFRISLALKNGIASCIVHALWNEIN